MIDREKLKQNAEKAKEHQKKKIIKNDAVKKIFDLYGVKY